MAAFASSEVGSSGQKLSVPGCLHGFVRLYVHRETTSVVMVSCEVFLFFEPFAFGYERSLQEGVDVRMSGLVRTFTLGMRGAL